MPQNMASEEIQHCFLIIPSSFYTQNGFVSILEVLYGVKGVPIFRVNMVSHDILVTGISSIWLPICYKSQKQQPITQFMCNKYSEVFLHLFQYYLSRVLYSHELNFALWS